MLDKCQRSIEYLRISLTDRCNLRCQYCMPEKGISWMPHNAILSYEEMIRIVEVASTVGVKKIRLTGGEPLVRKNVPYLVSELYKITGITEISITTNALLLKEQLDALVTAGLTGINISLDTINPERYKDITRGGEVEQVIEAIQEAKKYKNLKLKINCVPTFQSEQEIIEMVNFAKEVDVPLRFIELMPIGFGKKYKGMCQEEIRGLLTKTYGMITPYQGSMGNGPATYFKIEETNQIVGFISSLSHKFCSSCNRIRLTANGYLKGCLQYLGGLHLKPLLQQNITKQELEQKIKEVIYLKPKEHHFLGENTEIDETHEMHKIGG